MKGVATFLFKKKPVVLLEWEGVEAERQKRKRFVSFSKAMTMMKCGMDGGMKDLALLKSGLGLSVRAALEKESRK